jgi:uncharacterized lipoprotein YddW (UPF0748 family)
MYRKNFLLLIIFYSCFFNISAQYKKREMRGVWIATVANIDWPSKKGDTEAQKKEMLLMLDSLRSCNINTVIFQARPTSDAFYNSPLEPWSTYLTGNQGKAPVPFYDPLAFLIEEAHKRCMEVHVWLNPYRVTNNENSNGLVKEHIFFQKPYLFHSYGGKYLFDPGFPETRDYLVKVVADIVTRYDIDAIHFDDYFYPYRVAGKDFPDMETFRKYSRGIVGREEWRRDNVNMVVARLQDTIKAIKPWVEFGISPFGVWRNDTDDLRGSATRASCTNYDELYADILTWSENGWIDYVTPQLYWEIGKSVADYTVLATWWSDYIKNSKLYIGLYASGLEINKSQEWKNPNELVRQLRYNKDCEEIQGAMFYSVKYFLKNIQGLKDSLLHNMYKYPAIPPENLHIPDSIMLLPPANVRIQNGEFTAELLWDKVEGTGGMRAAYYVVYAFPESQKGEKEDPSYILAVTSDNYLDLYEYPHVMDKNLILAVSVINKYRQESDLSGFTKYEKKSNDY